MGANQSTINSGHDGNAISVSARLASRHAFQILKVHPNSPVSEAKVFPYFDYITSINGIEVSPDIPNLISEMARNHVNKPLKLTIYNSREDEEREVTIVPRTGWGGEGLLGCAIRFSPLQGVRDRVWHILKVHNNSPAQKAGLIAEQDYVIASPDLLLKSEEEFYELITQNTLRSVKLIVFNFKEENLREIQIVPDFSWGGEGCLGCDVGSGMVHWIPKKEKPVSSDAQRPAVMINPSNPSTSTASSYPFTSTGPANPVPSTIPSVSSTNDSLKIPQVPQVKVPSARPVVDFNHPIVNPASGNPGGNAGNVLNQSIFPESNVQPALAPPPIPASKPIISTAPVTFSEIEDDIPKPNFSVPSDIVNQ